MSRICSSRISTRRTNTRGSGGEQIFAPLFLTFESSHEIVVLKVLKKLLADTSLDVLRGFNALPFQSLDVRGNVNAADVAFRGRPLTIDPPFGNDTICVESFVELRCH